SWRAAMDYVEGVDAASSQPLRRRGAATSRHRHRTGIRHWPARSARAVDRRKFVVGLHFIARRQDDRGSQGARRHSGDRDLASALLFLDGRMGGAFRCANIFTRRRPPVGHARKSAYPLLARHNLAALGWAHLDQLRWTFRWRDSVALAGRRERQRRVAYERYPYGGARPALPQLHAQLSKSDSARR